MNDPYNSKGPGLSSPAIDGFSVSPDDGADLSVVTRALWVGGLGDVSVVMREGTTVTFAGVQGLLPVRVSRVRATGTTATSIVGLY